jgi:hypothetical protein
VLALYRHLPLKFPARLRTRDPDPGRLHRSGQPGLTRGRGDTALPRRERYWNISIDLPIEDHPDVSVIRQTWDGAGGLTK